MINVNMFEKDNLKVLGLLVRFNRNNMGLSLRDLGQLANVSHTQISNFERGIVILNSRTINDIFKVLKINFYDGKDISEEFDRYFKQIFKHIMFYDYDEAKILIEEIEVKKDIYENSILVVNFIIIRLLYYIITNTYLEDKDRILSQTENILEFFSDTQKQLFYFIQGLDKLNVEYYYDSRMFFRKALSLGNSKIDILIKEHYVVTLSKAYKWVDARLIADECILEYESQMNYVRAMRLRTRVAYDQIQIYHYDEAKEIYNYVKDFSIRYNVKDLENRCNTRLEYIAVLEKKYDIAERYLEKVGPEYAKIYYYVKFYILENKKDKEKIINYYNEIINLSIGSKFKDFADHFTVLMMKNNNLSMDKKVYERILWKLLDLSLSRDDADTIEYTAKTLIDFYKKERYYKKALEASEIYLHYLKFGVK